MRTANRSLVLAIAFLVLAIAAPTYAADDSPGLLDTVEKSVDSLTGPAADTAGPAKQLTTTVDSALGGRTSLSELQLVSAVDHVLTGGTVAPTGPMPEGGAGGEEPLLELTESAATAEQVVASRPLRSVLQLSSFSAAEPATDVPAAEGAHIPGTSTLPDGGSPLTLAWLVLWCGVTGAGAVVLRRARA